MRFLKLAALFLLGLAAGALSAQSIYVYPTTVTIARGGYQTITAVVQGVNNKTVTWTTTGGTLIGTNPSTANAPSTIALYTLTAGTYTVTATTNTGAVTATSTVTVTASPTITTGHPRLMMTLAMVAGLQAKATTGNMTYQNQKAVANGYLTTDNTIWSWTCNGGTGLPSSDQLYASRENDAYEFAFMSVVAPTSGERNTWGCYAHDVWTYVEARYQSYGNIPGGANEWSDGMYGFVLTPDWLMAGGYLSSGEISNVRSYFTWFVQIVMNDGNGATPPTCVPSTCYNSVQQFQLTGDDAQYSLGSMRFMGNNYTMSEMLMMVAIGLTFDDNTTDDPPLPNTCMATRYQMCSDYTAGSLHAYWSYFDGALLYKMWAHLEDPTVTQPAYNAFYSNMASQPTCLYSDILYPCMGDGRNGESSEGSNYGYSLYRLTYAMNVLHTTGYDDPTVNGPQVSLENSSFFDTKYISDLQFLTGFPEQSGVPNYGYLTTGDSNNMYEQVLNAQGESALMVEDSYFGRTDRTNALLWTVLNYSKGGPLGTSGGCTSSCGWNADITNTNISQTMSVDMFLALGTTDPLSSLPSDPRPSLPTDLYNPSYNQHIMVRNNWTPGSYTFFNYFASNALINHEKQLAGQFEIYANGEWITKPQTEFDNYNDTVSVASRQNMASILNSTGSSCEYTPVYCPYWAGFSLGGQMTSGYQSALVGIDHSELPAYVAAISNTSNAYNGFYPTYDDYSDVLNASRSLVYLRGSNQVAVYDRAATGFTASTKGVYLNTTGPITLSGTTASWLTRSSTQKAYYTSLLPSGATVADAHLIVAASIVGTYSTIQNGTSQTFTAQANYGDGTNGSCPAGYITWTSGNTGVATINSSGVATAVGTGTTLITMTCLQNFQATGTLTVAGSSSGTWSQVSDLTQAPDWEPSSTVGVTPSGTPLSSQFLSVLEFGPSSLTKSTTTLVQSTSGQAFDGASIGTSCVMFIRAQGAFTGTTYPASSCTTHYVADLTPGATYNVSGAGAPATATADTAGVLTFAATGSGNITVGNSTSGVTLSGGVIFGGSVRIQ